MSEILIPLVVGVGAFVAGIFVYRNNVKDFGPIADKIDGKYDTIESEVKELKTKLDAILEKIK
ncbi:structural protein [Cellulophaga phage phi4:1]|uniref:Structural protein n=5 Tax=Lightbulbvirus TaxID=1918522 RepID=A0A0S2MWD2_9CAUD|nr:structural protein [Cellulophaga phage phi4:1]YP_008241519.1 structural protein [Cellulophaga phage phi17:2]ALO80033.1 structural protein [Cellulophaga phage phi4:1_13]ALO80230.1 structural protein [Cellulophaga phage phi4:1_18]ALO80427.1 structural protein [Cellulophaga phage phi17:2_18]AGO47557.1 structural protein [Cellulophaga phage phi17:2]AGO49437.1 structural protein [Cellulophaga phage phi4:1]